MTDELALAFERLANRGQHAGASTVVRRAFEQYDRSLRADRRNPRARNVFFATAAATVAVVVGLVAVVQSRLDDIGRVNVDSALSPSTTGEVLTVLAVGSDARPGIERERADAVMLLRVNRTTGATAVLSLPRDLFIDVAGTNRQAKLADVLAVDPTSLIETVRAITGVAVNHYMQFDFRGFARVVDAAGGVKLRIPTAVRDHLAGLDLPAGCTLLGGDEALAFVRSRHLVEVTSTGSRIDPTGDLGRVARQQALFLAALGQLPSTLDNPRTIERVAEAVTENVRVDERFSIREMLAFVKDWARHSNDVRLFTMPTVSAQTAMGAVVLHSDQQQLSRTLADFTADAPRQQGAAPSRFTGCG